MKHFRGWGWEGVQLPVCLSPAVQSGSGPGEDGRLADRGGPGERDPGAAQPGAAALHAHAGGVSQPPSPADQAGQPPGAEPQLPSSPARWVWIESEGGGREGHRVRTMGQLTSLWLFLGSIFPPWAALTFPHGLQPPSPHRDLTHYHVDPLCCQGWT